MAHYFFVRWNAYKKLVDFNYMDHVGLFGCLAEEIGARFGGPVDILDIGCGDAAPLNKWLSHLDIGHYSGVDEAANALELASEKLTALEIPHRLFPGELTEVLPSLERQYDVIIMSFCLHHFDTPKRKEWVLAQCRRLLRPGGIMAMIDVVTEEAESRDDFLSRCELRIKASYTELDEEELDIILTHIWAADFPESFSTFQRIGGQAGFDAVDEAMRDQTGMHRLITFSA
jgi:ubiquinone/menaquinone biosynthesis C-methylase UbiE